MYMYNILRCWQPILKLMLYSQLTSLASIVYSYLYTYDYTYSYIHTYNKIVTDRCPYIGDISETLLVGTFINIFNILPAI